MRELKEETGLVGDYCKQAYEFTDSFNGEEIHFIFFSCKTKSSEVTLSYEHDKAKWVEFEKIARFNDYPVHQQALEHIKGKTPTKEF